MSVRREFERRLTRAGRLVDARRRRIERWHDGLAIRERSLRLAAWFEASCLADRLKDIAPVIYGVWTLEDFERHDRRRRVAMGLPARDQA